MTQLGPARSNTKTELTTSIRVREKTKLNNKGLLFSLLNEALKFINVRTIRLLPSLKNNHVESSRDKTRMVENLLCIGWWRQMTQATISRVL